jgi:hypothetical protein
MISSVRWQLQKGKNPGLQTWTKIVMSLMVLSIAINACLSLAGTNLPHIDLHKDGLGSYEWTLAWMGYVKVSISLIKFIPQVSNDDHDFLLSLICSYFDGILVLGFLFIYIFI